MTFSRILRVLGWPLRAVLLGLLAAYRGFFGGAFGGRCRFHPSCSSYAQEAIRSHGALKGSALAVLRVARCSPLSAGGLDPVPPPGAWSTKGMKTSYESEA